MWILQVKRHGTQFIHFLLTHLPYIHHHKDEEYNEDEQPYHGEQIGVVNLLCILPDEFEHDLFLSGLCFSDICAQSLQVGDQCYDLFVGRCLNAIFRKIISDGLGLVLRFWLASWSKPSG